MINSMNQECVPSVTKKIHEIQEKLQKQNAQLENGQTAYHREASRLESLQKYHRKI